MLVGGSGRGLGFDLRLLCLRWRRLRLPVGVARNLQRLFIDDLDVDVILAEALDVAVYLPSLLDLVDLEVGSKCTLAL